MTNTKTNTNISDAYQNDDIVKDMVERYTSAGENYETQTSVVEQLATELGKSVQSIRGKLQSLGVYKAKVKATKGNVITKDTIADNVAALVSELGNTNVSEGEIESLAKANKTMLIKLQNVLKSATSKRKELYHESN